MSNIGKLGLTIKNVENQQALDPSTRIDVKRKDETTILRFRELNLPLNVQLDIPAYPQESNLYCYVTPKRYRGFRTEYFTLSTSAPGTIDARTMRLPQHWSAVHRLESALRRFHADQSRSRKIPRESDQGRQSRQVHGE